MSKPILHAEFLKAYADGQSLQFRHNTTDEHEWIDLNGSHAIFSFDAKHLKFRIKPRTILINGIEVPEPVREPLEDRQEYWFVTITNNDFCFRSAWKYRPEDHYRLKIGLIHMTREAAETHARALLSFTAKD